MSQALKIARGLTLPLDAVTKTFAMLAQRRKGKTYTANVVAEEMVRTGIPWVALDPTGAWWGLRASADGKSKGLDVLVIGGEHGQLPLERTAGKLMADLVVDKPGHYVLDFSLFESKAAERQFATDFAERFYRRKGQSGGPMHLFVDEADMFVPQRTPSGDQRMLGAFEAIVRRGGIRGIGSTLISQRAAVVNKNVLEQIDVLICLRTVGPNDQKALKAYIDAFGSEEEQRELMGSLASLKLGEAWIWEPGTDLFERVQIRERRTFNSSATPKAGEKRTEPVALAEVDLDELRERIASTIEKAKAEDPKELQKQVRELRRELDKRPTEVEVQEVEKVVEVPVLANGALEKLDSAVQEIVQIADSWVDAASEISSELKRLGNGRPAAPPRRPSPPPKAPVRRAPAPAPAVAAAGGGGDLKKAERLALSVLIQYPQGRTTSQLAIIAGYSAKGGGFRNALSRLRTLGYITTGEPIYATDEGIAALPDIDPLPTGAELLEHHMARLKKAEREVLQVLYDCHPDALTPEEVAERTDSRYEPTGGGFRNALGKLRTLELIEGRGEMRASDALFEEVAT